MDRRLFIRAMLASGVSLASLGYIQPGDAVASGAGGVKPARLRVGDTVRLVAPAGVIYEKVRIDIALESLTALGLKPTLGNHVYDRHGYFAGRDEDRAADINAAFADPSVKAVFALSGGWGAARTLPYLDFDLIKENPKVIIGYSDITALLNAIYAKTGLTTFHGPNATTRWTDFNVQSFQDMVMKGTTPELVNPQVRDNSLAVRTNRIQTINAGTAEGALVGGNLTVLTALAGTPYLPDFTGKILFLEDVGEAIYRVDRMLSTLALAGVFEKVAGIVFGGFTKVGNDGAGFGSFALMDIFEQYGKQHGKPCFYGAMFGHVENARTIPIGGTARIDADKGSIHLLVPAVR